MGNAPHVDPPERPGLIAAADLLRAIAALRNGRALAALLGCGVVGVLIAGLLGATGRTVGAALAGGLVLFVAGATGVNAAGVLLMDQARRRPPHRLGDALTIGLVCVPKFLALALATVVAVLVVYAAIAFVFVVCRLPYIGPLLFVAAFPAAVVAAGVACCAAWLGFALMLPAVWEGAGVGHAFAQALTVLRRRPAETILLTASVVVLAAVVGFVLFGAVGAGLVPALALAARIIGADFTTMAAAAPGLAWQGDSYAIAGTVGAGLLWVLAGSLVALVYLLGSNLVYLRVTEGVEPQVVEAALQEGLDDARRRAAELARKAAETAELARQAARRAAVATPAAIGAERPSDPAAGEVTPSTDAGGHAPVSRASPESPLSPPTFAETLPPLLDEADFVDRPIAVSCPHCLAAVQRDDLFCGTCGSQAPLDPPRLGR